MHLAHNAYCAKRYAKRADRYKIFANPGNPRPTKKKKQTKAFTDYDESDEYDGTTSEDSEASNNESGDESEDPAAGTHSKRELRSKLQVCQEGI